MNDMDIIEPEELKKKLGKKENIFLLDVRTPEEFQEHKIEGSVNIPITELQRRMDEIPKDKEIITICEHGNRSLRAAYYLNKNGYKALSLTGGMEDWNRLNAIW